MAQYTAEEVEKWTSIEDARKRAAGRFGEDAALEALWERIRSGLIPTASLRWTHQLGDNGAPHPETNPRILTTEDWTAYKRALPRNLWRGEASFVYPSKNYSPDRHMKCFEIVCDPAALDLEFAPRGAAVDPEQELPKTDTPRGSPVSDALLAEWAVLFRKTYPTGSEQMATKSAAGMFQGHSVPRRKLRDALAKAGKLSPGRPAKS